MSRPGAAALLALGLLAAPGGASENIHPKAGSSSAAFLKTGMGARPVSMGEAYTAAAEDAYSVFWNPAGLAGQPRKSMNYTFHNSLQAVHHDFAGYAQPWRSGTNGAALGLGLISVRMPGDLERRSGSRENDPFNPISSPEGSFGASDLALSASYARRLGERHAAGATLKFIRQSIDGESAQTAALDFGWRLKDAAPRWDLGAVIVNLGPGVKFQSRYALPLTFKLGTAYRLKRHDSTAAFDVSVPRDDYPILAWGLETRFRRMLSIRAGYRYRWFGNPLGAMSGVRTGGGFDYLGRFTLDYAFAPFGDLGKTHQLTLGWRFGGRSRKQAAAGRASVGEHAVPERSERDAASADRDAVDPRTATEGSWTAPTRTPAPPAPATAAATTPEELPTMHTPQPKEAGQPETGYTSFKVQARLRNLSGRNQMLKVDAQAPSDDWDLRGIEFYVAGQSPEGLAVQVRAADENAPLPGGIGVRQAFWLKLTPDIHVRSVRLRLRAPGAGLSALGLFDGDWKPLAAKQSFESADGEWTILSGDLPQAIAVK